jgi:DNA-binding LacI/PurR family transcriptional regulator
MSTLRDVARRAGVSVATASRVANGADRVRPETRDRVERAMRELLYVPPRREAPTGVIGLLVPELSNPVFPALAQAMESRAAALGLATILCNTDGSPAAEAEYVHMLLERRVEGMIFISSEIADLQADHTHYARLLGEGARLVFVNGAAAELDAPAVGVDERVAGQLATQHLLELGHGRIGFVAGPEHYLPTREKDAGRRAALAAAGLEADGPVVYTDFSVEGGRRALHELAAMDGGRPGAVFCSSDLMAIGALAEASALGLRVPEDVSVVGFDGIEAGSWTVPQLTTIEQPIGEIAATAVEALRTRINDPSRELPHYVFRPKLLARGSTAKR